MLKNIHNALRIMQIYVNLYTIHFMDFSNNFFPGPSYIKTFIKQKTLLKSNLYHFSRR